MFGGNQGRLLNVCFGPVEGGDSMPSNLEGSISPLWHWTGGGRENIYNRITNERRGFARLKKETDSYRETSSYTVERPNPAYLHQG